MSRRDEAKKAFTLASMRYMECYERGIEAQDAAAAARRKGELERSLITESEAAAAKAEELLALVRMLLSYREIDRLPVEEEISPA
jgi:hypothetical protein